MIVLDTHVWVWWVHGDPADQIIVATARVFDSPLATVDTRILAYPHVTLSVHAAGLSVSVVDRCRRMDYGCWMKGEFTAIIEEAPEGGYWAICPEVPGANGQGETVDEAKESLRAAIRLLFEDRIEDMTRGLPDDAIQTVVAL